MSHRTKEENLAQVHERGYVYGHFFKNSDAAAALAIEATMKW